MLRKGRGGLYKASTKEERNERNAKVSFLLPPGVVGSSLHRYPYHITGYQQDRSVVRFVQLAQWLEQMSTVQKILGLVSPPSLCRSSSDG